MAVYIGVDIGGTTIKGICCDEKGTIFSRGETDTGVAGGANTICDNISRLIGKLTGGKEKEVAGVGVGCPGMIDGENGIVVFSGNLKLKNFLLAKEIGKRCGHPVKIGNDAHVAALGEARFGTGDKHENSLLVTLGTGVGGGIIINGQLYEGCGGVGSEIGHMVIVSGGRKCTCGRRGCFEAYASASALTRDTQTAMKNDPASKMWSVATPDTCTAKTPFDFIGVDKTADAVIDTYLEMLAEGLANLANIFRPEVIMLGGGVSKQGRVLTEPLQKMVNEKIFAGTEYATVKITTATLGNLAGSYGAAALFM